jgi:eukaryotic-like serine/threonine-protein kinase
MHGYVTGERWKQIEEIYNSALDCAPERRSTFVAQACKGDDDLRSEIEDLVRREESPGWALPEHPVWAAPDEAVIASAADVRFTPGARLGPYEIVERIGAGGMGFVFRAIDTRLGRSVAIKTSQAAFSDRFGREARTIAALNHPNICTLHDTGPDYLVMELIEGPTLADRIRKGPLALDEALKVARQIAAALEAAHEKGIVHRDLKPANIKIQLDGSVKVLDFGLAKSGTQSEPSGDSMELKRAGLILGTQAYMSPEHALGQEVDKRCDIWAFGVVLYEMLSGVRPFEGATAPDCLAAIAQKEPDLSKVPTKVRRLLSLCLEKDARKRLRDLGDWEHLLDPEEARPNASPLPKLRKAAWIGIPAVLLAAAGAWSVWLRPASPVRTTRFQINLPENIYFDRYVSVSPDGQKLVFNATGEQDGLWIHNLDTLEWRRLPGTEHAKAPFWSPDSRSVGFVVHGFSGSDVRKIDLSGGSAATVYTSTGHDLGEGAWNQKRDLLIGSPNGEPLWRISATDSAAAVTAIDRAHGETSHGRPQFLPDGKHFLYFISGSAEVEGTYSGSLDDVPAAQPRERIVRVMARYANGKLLFLRGGILMAQTFDADRRQLTGEPAPLAEHVQTVYPIPVFSVSAGVLAYRSGTEAPGTVFTWFDRHGKEIGTVGQPGQDGGPRISPDGQRAAVANGGPMPNIWILDFARGLRTRFTFEPPAMSAVWSPEGKRIFYSSGPKLESIFAKDAGGSEPETELLRQPGSYLYPTSVSPDARFLLYYAEAKPKGPGVPGETWMLPLAKGGRPVHLLGGQFSENRANFSPDGRWIAYRSNESGRFEVYIRSVLNSDSGALSLGEGKWQVSRESVSPTIPAWRHDSRELFYITPQDVITAVTVDSSHGTLQLGSPTPLFTAPCSCEFDVSADGQRFLVHGAAGAGSKAPITVVLNWRADMKAR